MSRLCINYLKYSEKNIIISDYLNYLLRNNFILSIRIKARWIMPCGQCGNMLIIYEGDEICPTCKQLSVLKFDTAVSVLSRLVELTTKIFDDELRKWERDTLLGNLSARRELFSREFFREHSVLNTGRLVAFTLLIRRAVKFGNYRGKVPQESQDIELLVRAYEDVREFESMLLRVKANENAVLSLCKFNPKSFTLEEGRKTFKVVDTEKCRILERMFARHNIFPATDGATRI